MAEDFGYVLRSIREAAGLSLARLAARTQYAKAVIGHVETGRRRPTVALAIACDRVLGTAPLLTTVVEMDERQGDHMKRRALLASITTAVGISGLSGASALAAAVRHGLLDAADVTENWDAVIEDYSRRLLTEPSAAYGQSLLTQLMIARQQNIDLGPDSDRMRAVAQLSLLYGLWLGNTGDIAGARGWYRTAGMLADRSGDSAVRTYVRGRALSRGVWEGDSTARETVAGVDKTLVITNAPNFGALESLAALVHVHGYTSNLAAGRLVISNMRRLADRLPHIEPGRVAGPAERVAIHNNWLECRLGNRTSAEKAFAEVEPLARPVLQWRTEATIYYAHALVRDGEVRDGVRLALSATKAYGQRVRAVGLGIRDLMSAVPVDHRSDDLDELEKYAVTGRLPWESLAR